MKKYGFEYRWLDDYDGEVTDSDIDHVMSKMKEGYIQGELCSLGDDGETEHRGWWKRI